MPPQRFIIKHKASDKILVAVEAEDLKDVVEKNRMTWPQYWDRDHRLRQAFGVKAIPTYVLIDAEGIERLRVVGAGFHESRELSAEIDKQIGMK